MSDQAIDRTTLPIRRPPFQGVAKKTLDGSQPDWNFVAPIPVTAHCSRRARRR